jgi:hypothetical protein
MRPPDHDEPGGARRLDAGLIDMTKDQRLNYRDRRELVGPTGKELGDAEPVLFLIVG